MPLKFPEERTGPALFKTYLQERGITPESVVACGLEVISKSEAQDRLNLKNSIAYNHYLYIPHTADYGSVRALGELSGFATGLAFPKLVVPKGDVRMYVPPLINWEEFSGTLYLCESAVKAISMAQHGYTAIAGNGVAGIYTNAGFAKGWPDTLMESGAVEKVVILFDANWQTNKNVSAAIRKLASGINQRYPDVPIKHKQLELYEDKDQGIDDAIAREGVEWLHEWLGSEEGLVDIEVSPLQKHLDELNERYVITKLPNMIIDRLHRQHVRRADFTEVAEAHRSFKEWVPSGKGQRQVEIYPAKEWLKWDQGNRVERQVYLPGGVEMDLDASYYNTWYDDGVEAKEGDITPFLTVYKNAIPDPVERQLLLESMAWMTQNRGTRIEKCFVLIGPDQGTGKSLLVETFGKVMGDSNFASISAHQFGNHFNAAMAGREVMLMDDADKLHTQSVGLFKSFVTNKTYMVEKKGKDAYKADSTAVLFVTSNDYTTLPMDVEDRRVHVCAFNPLVHYQQGDQWWKDYVSWLEGGGYAILRWWLEGLDLSAFDPSFMPPMTATKIHMEQSGKSDIENWVEAVHHDIDAELLGNARSFYTRDEMCMIYHGPGWDAVEPHDKARMKKEMDLALVKRFKKVGKAGIRTGGGKRNRYWGIRKDGGTANVADVTKDVRDYANLVMT